MPRAGACAKKRKDMEEKEKLSGKKRDAAITAYAKRDGRLVDLARELYAKYDLGLGQHTIEIELRKARRALGMMPQPNSDELDSGSYKNRPKAYARAIAEYCAKMPGAAAAEIARAMLREIPDLDYGMKYVAEAVRAHMINNKSSVPDADIAFPEETDEKAERWAVREGRYEWKTPHGPISMPVEEMDQIFYEYSRHGLDLSQSQMRQRHGLKIWQWHAIKTKLLLYKDSNVMSPHTEETTPPDMFAQLVKERIGAKANDRQRVIESAYEKNLVKQYKNVVEKDAANAFAIEKFLDELNDACASLKSKKFAVRRAPSPPAAPERAVAVIADLHVGARSESLLKTPNYSPAAARALLAQAAERINQTGAKNVTVAFLGDMIESFTGLNHPNSWMSVEYGMTGAAVVKEAIEIIEEFISQTNNVTEIIGIAGNHDRASSSNKEDTRGQIANVIFYVLKRIYGKNISVKFADLVLAQDIDGIRYIFAHGDKKNPRCACQAALEHGRQDAFNLVITAHVHSRSTKEDRADVRHVVAPPIFTGNRYSDENAWNARPGFLIVKNQNNLPEITDCPLGSL